MKIWFRTLSLTIALFLTLATTGRVDANADPDIDHEVIDQFIAAKMRLPRIPGLALAVVKGDRIVYLKGYGQADSSGRAVTPQTPFIIGSITKSFTALAVMQLVEARKVELDSPVQKYIPWFRVADSQASARITVRQLLYQRSGLPMLREAQAWTDQDDLALERAVRRLQTVKLDYEPGQSFGYSNANYQTLGLIVQYVSGQSYEQYLKEQIFAPLEMRNSFLFQDEALRHGMASGHRWWFGFPIEYHAPNNRAELPAGYMISSAEDMAHFLIAEMNGGRYREAAVLSAEGIALTHSEPVANTYAMGWELVSTNGRTLINNDGGTANFQCSIFLDPQERVGVFVIANVMNALDAFSSPHGSTVLDGTSTRGIARTVLSIATNQPLPDQGKGIRLLYAVFDIVITGLTAMLIFTLVKIPERYRKLARQGIPKRSSLISRSVMIAVLHIVGPLVVLLLAQSALGLNVLVMYLPDFSYWFAGVALVVVAKGLVEMILLWRTFQPARR